MQNERNDKPLFIHVGHYKCASTFLQRTFFPIHPEIELVTQETHPLFDDLLTCRDYDYDPQKIRDYFQSNDKVRVLSSENLIGDIYLTGLNGDLYARRLKETFSDPTIIIIIRNQVTMLESHFLQTVNGGGAGRMGINDFFKTTRYNKERMGFSWRYLEYYKNLRYYQDMFGKDKVILYLFEELKENPKAFLDRLCKDIGVSILGDPPTAKRRPRHSPYTYLFMRTISRFRHGRFNMAGGILDRFKPIPIGKIRYKLNYLYNRFPILGKDFSFMSQKNRQAIIEYYREDNNLLREYTGIDLEKYGYPL
jgi:hypothetical protein